MAFCSNCGSEIKEGDKFCTNCGAQIKSSVEVNSETIQYKETNDEAVVKPKKKKGRVIRIILLIVLILVAAAAGFIYWVANRDFPKDINKENTNDVETAGIVFPVSEAFVYSDDQSNSNLDIYCTSGGKAMIVFQSADTKGMDLSLISDDDTNGIIDKVMYEYADNMLDNAKEVDVKGIEMSDLKCWTKAYQGTYQGIEAYFKAEYIYNSAADTLCGVYLVCTNAYKDKAILRYDKMLKSASVKAVKSTSTEGVSSSLKELLDSYEDFMDEYIDFMKKYKSNSSDVTSMIGDYTEIMQKYTDFTTKISSLDTNNMSAADYAYYMEVTTRIYKKLAEIGM